MSLGYPGSLHAHSDYSNLRLRDCIIKPKDLIDYAIELGHEVVGFTDHEDISGAIEIERYYDKVKKEHPNFKVIRGNEIYLCRNGLSQENFVKGEDKFYHFILLAKDAKGHQQLREISTRAWLRSWMAQKIRRVPTYYSDLQEIIGADPGHVIGSTACLGGRLPELILQEADENYIHQWIYNMKKIFGEEDFYLEMQPSENIEQITVNKKLYELTIETNTKFIITTDAHYLKKSDAPVHKAYLRSQNGEREVDSFYASTYMMDTEELEKYFPYFSKEKFQEGYEAIIEIKNKCEDYSLLKPLRIPELKRKEYADYSRIAPMYYNKMPSLRLFVESAHSGDKVLANAVIDKLQKKSEEFDNKETYDALEICLKSTWESSLVNETHWSDYYLNLQKIIDTCWEAGSLVGPGRGSGTGFLLLYVLDIIQINHLRENVPMFPWRFLNPRRVSPLDVDFDIEGARRNQVLTKFREVYGEDRVANVITFGTEKSKSSIITAARGLGMEVEDAQYIASLVPSDRGTPRTLEQCYYGDKENGLEPVALFVKEMKNHPQLWEVAQKIQGLKCRMG